MLLQGRRTRDPARRRPENTRTLRGPWARPSAHASPGHCARDEAARRRVGLGCRPRPCGWRCVRASLGRVSELGQKAGLSETILCLLIPCLLSCVPCLGGGVPGPLASRRDVAPTRPRPHQPPLWEKPPVGLFWGPGLHLCDPCTFPTANPAGAPGPRPPPITVTGAAGPSSP